MFSIHIHCFLYVVHHILTCDDMPAFIEIFAIGAILGCWIMLGVLLVKTLIERALEWYEERQERQRDTDALIAAFERAPGRYSDQSYGTWP